MIGALLTSFSGLTLQYADSLIAVLFNQLICGLVNYNLTYFIQQSYIIIIGMWDI